MSIDINGLNRDILLEALWKSSSPAAFFRFSGLPSPSFDINEAKRVLRDGYADYVCGRSIKTDIYSKDIVDPTMYDRDNGTGTFKKVVDLLRKSQC